MPLDNCLLSVTSHYNIGGGLGPLESIGKGATDAKQIFSFATNILAQAKVVTVNSKRLVELLSPTLPDVLYMPNGVDTDFFSPAPPRKWNPKKIRIGWVGVKKAAKNYELIETMKPRFENLGVEFCEIAVQKGVGKVASHQEVRSFYHGLDFYLCSSWHEGTPNPCLEAASCSVPLITTRVGNMPELIKPGINGYFIDPTSESLEQVLSQVRELSANDMKSMRQTIRGDIEAEWDWSNRMPAYHAAFEQLLA